MVIFKETITTVPLTTKSFRSGRYVRQIAGYSAFIPEPLPLRDPIRIDAELQKLLSDADRALGRLDGVATTLPNPDLFVSMYIRHEAVLSSQIEGTRSSLDDVVAFEAVHRRPRNADDPREVLNYVAAMNHGLARLTDLPLSLRLIREMHRRLLEGVRGGEKTPGEFRKTQNWIGSANCTLASADFVPPPPHEMAEALANFETFLHDRDSLPVLVHAAIAHAHFETIHPFLDGNGRIGRMLITLLLCERTILRQPLLYLSYYFKAHRAQYYDRLTAVRHDGDWEGWLAFFLRGIKEVSLAATDTAQAILALRDRHRELLGKQKSTNAFTVLDHLFLRPYIDARAVQTLLDTTPMTANKVLLRLADLGIIQEMSGKKRNRFYGYLGYLALFDKQLLRHPPQEPTASPPGAAS